MKTPFRSRSDFSCGGLVVDPSNKNVLVVKVESLAKTIVWTFPKGHPERNESDTEAALREVREETGWECRILKQLIDVDYYFVHENVRTHKTVRWFLMEPVKKAGDFNKGEILDCEWVDWNEAERRVTYDSDKTLLGCVEKNGNGH